MFYAEGDWKHHLDSFTELPDRSILYHVDQGDIFETHRVLGHKFCLSGGVPNFLLSYGKPDQVRECCKKIIDEVAQDGGYIMDAGAIMQNDTSIENMRAMTEFTREYGVYSSGSSSAPAEPSTPAEAPPGGEGYGMAGRPEPRIKPGICFPWEEKVVELPDLLGDPEELLLLAQALVLLLLLLELLASAPQLLLGLALAVFGLGEIALAQLAGRFLGGLLRAVEARERARVVALLDAPREVQQVLADALLFLRELLGAAHVLCVGRRDPLAGGAHRLAQLGHRLAL